MKSIYILFLSVLFFSTTLFAQELTAPDRPGFGFSSSIVNNGVYQAETGFLLGENLQVAGPFNFRTGIAKNLELRAGLGSIQSESPAVTVQSFGLKYLLASTDNLGLAVLGRMNLPFLNSNYGYYRTRFSLLGDFKISDAISINSNLGYGDFVGKPDYKNGSVNFSITPSYALTKKMAVYLSSEYDNIDEKIDILGGLTYLISSSIQVDAGIQTDNDYESYSIGAGISASF